MVRRIAWMMLGCKPGKKIRIEVMGFKRGQACMDQRLMAARTKTVFGAKAENVVAEIFAFPQSQKDFRGQLAEYFAHVNVPPEEFERLFIFL